MFSARSCFCQAAESNIRSTPVLGGLTLAVIILIDIYSTGKALLAAYVPRVLGESRMRVYVSTFLWCIGSLLQRQARCDEVIHTCAVCREGGDRCHTTATGDCIILRSCSPGTCRCQAHAAGLEVSKSCRVDVCRTNVYVSARKAPYGLRLGAGVWRICTHMGHVRWQPPGITENRPSRSCPPWVSSRVDTLD